MAIYSILKGPNRVSIHDDSASLSLSFMLGDIGLHKILNIFGGNNFWHLTNLFWSVTIKKMYATLKIWNIKSPNFNLPEAIWCQVQVSSVQHLYSTLRVCGTGFLMCFTVHYAPQINHLAVSCQYERKPPSPRSTPWGAYRSTSLIWHWSSYNHLQYSPVLSLTGTTTDC